MENEDHSRAAEHLSGQALLMMEMTFGPQGRLLAALPLRAREIQRKPSAIK